MHSNWNMETNKIFKIEALDTIPIGYKIAVKESGIIMLLQSKNVLI